MQRPRAAVFAAALLAIAGSSISLAQTDPAPTTSISARSANAEHRLTLTTERVAMFKDGYALVVKTATGVADERGRVYTDEVPDAAMLGCFWATTEAGEIAAMRAELVTEVADEVSESVALSLAELLRGNAGRSVTITMRDPATKPIEGSIVRVLEAPPAATHPTTDAAITSLRIPPAGENNEADRPREAGVTRVALTPVGGQYVLIQAASSQQVIAINDIASLSGTNLDTRTTHTHKVTRTRKRLGFDLGDSAAGQPARLRIMYFAPGVRWIPTYRLAVNADNRSGVLALQGELLNELEDFQSVALDLVVGVPNFRFRHTVSPLVLERTLRNALYSAAPDIMGRQNAYSNAMFAQRAAEWGSRDEQSGIAGADLAPELGAGAEQDLFVYSRPTLDLNRGERATVPVLKQDVTFDHLYTLDLSAVRDPRAASAAQYACKSPGGPSTPPPAGESPAGRFNVNQVWHQIELKNSSNAPWTTGAAMVMGGAHPIPIAQDLLRYTPAGGRVLLPLTVAVDIRAELTEEEVSREENALKRNGTSYTLVKARSTITLTSSRGEPSKTRISLGLGGRAAEASDQAKVVITGHSSADWGNNDPGPVNNHSDLTWNVELAPNQTKTLTVEFNYYTY